MTPGRSGRLVDVWVGRWEGDTLMIHVTDLNDQNAQLLDSNAWSSSKSCCADSIENSRLTNNRRGGAEC